MQADAVAWSEDSFDELDPTTGDPLNQERFLIRRGRIRAEGERGALFAAMELDGNTIDGPDARILAAQVGWRHPQVEVVAGLFRTPFGFEVNMAERDKWFLEPPAFARAFFPGNYDGGVMVRGAYGVGRFVLAATNHPWDVDTALRRPGRLDRTLLVLPPDVRARRAILAAQLAERPSEGVDVDALARATERFSGADLVHLVEAAAELALAASIDTGTARPIGHADFTTALAELHDTTTDWCAVARNYAEFAGEQRGEYDDLLDYLRTRGGAA